MRVIISRVVIAVLSLIVISCGGSGDGASSDVSILPPAKVIEQAMQAQVNGDIETFLKNCAQENASPEEIALNVAVLNAVKDSVSLSAFKFEPLATGIYSDSTVAIVRGLVSYTINGAETVKNGVLVTLKKENNAWKIVQILSDGLLNQQIYEDSLLITSASLSYPGIALAVTPPQALSELNQKLNAWIESDIGLAINVPDLIWKGHFSAIGSIPGGGDIIAGIEGVCSIIQTSDQLYEECSKNGLSPIAMAKITEIELGVFSLAAEPIPIFDDIADTIAAGAAQVTYNLERKEAIRVFQSALLGVSIADTGLSFHPYISRYPGYSYPVGLMSFVDGIDENSYSTLTEINVSKPEWVGIEVPMKIYGYLDFDFLSGLLVVNRTIQAEIALDLGGDRISENTVRLEVDVTEMFGSTSNPIIIHSGLFQPVTSLVGKITCHSPVTQFSVTLSNNEVTKSVPVATIMSQASSLYMETGSTDVDDKPIIDLYLGSSIETEGLNRTEDINIFVTTPLGEIDLTSNSECLNMDITHPEIAMLTDQNSIISVTGVNAGETYLNAKHNELAYLDAAAKIVVHGVPFIEMYRGVITSVNVYDPDVTDDVVPICLEQVGQEEYAFVAENGGLFDVVTNELLGYISGDQLHVEISGDIFDGTIDLGTWSDGASCSGTYQGGYLSLTELKNIQTSCETVYCDPSFEINLRNLIDLKEAL